MYVFVCTVVPRNQGLKREEPPHKKFCAIPALPQARVDIILIMSKV